MSVVTIGIIVFLAMIVLVMLGVPIFVSVMGCSIVGILWVGGPTMLMSQLSSGVLASSASYTYAVIPLFILVGALAEVTHIAEGTFDAAKAWLGRFRGGLLYTIIGANAIFGACSGVSSASAVVFSKIAAPELKKHGYDENLTLGCIASASALAVLIPPSIATLTVCLLAGISIGTGLICGLATGIELIIIMFVFVKIISIVRPKKVPPVTDEDRSVTWKDRVKALRLLLPILALFFLIVGGSYWGWFPATVGGGIASVAILIYALALRVPMKKIVEAFRDGAQTFSGIFIIIVAGTLFSRFIALTGMAEGLTKMVGEAGLSPYIVFLIIIVFYVLCGMAMNCMTIIIITIPVVFPLLTSLGFNGFVVCTVLVLLSELGCVTPPFGLTAFTIGNVLRISPMKVFKGAAPFLVIYFICIISAVFIPQIVLWLPRLMGAAV